MLVMGSKKDLTTEESFSALSATPHQATDLPHRSLFRHKLFTNQHRLQVENVLCVRCRLMLCVFVRKEKNTQEEKRHQVRSEFCAGEKATKAHKGRQALHSHFELLPKIRDHRTLVIVRVTAPTLTEQTWQTTAAALLRLTDAPFFLFMALVLRTLPCLLLLQLFSP